MAEVVAETERLRLRTWDEADEQPFYALMNTPAVTRWLGGTQTPEQWHEGFERLRSYQREHGHTFWIVERRADAELLGWCGLKRVNAPGASCPGEIEVAWRFRDDVWGQGFAKEAAIASIDLAFARFAAPQVVALTVAGNAASQGLMKRLGMKRREDLDYVDTRFANPGEYNPAIVYSIAAADWREARERALS